MAQKQSTVWPTNPNTLTGERRTAFSLAVSYMGGGAERAAPLQARAADSVENLTFELAAALGGEASSYTTLAADAFAAALAWWQA